MKYYYFISHQWLRSRLEPACNVRFLFHPLNQVLDLGTLVQQLRVVFSHPVDEGEDMKISPGEVVTSKELSSSGLQPRLQNTLTENRLNWNMIIVLTHQSCRYSLGHDLSGHGALLPLVRLVPGSNPLVDHVIDSINYLISLSHLQVSSASQTILSSEVSETRASWWEKQSRTFSPGDGHGLTQHLTLNLGHRKLTIGQLLLHIGELFVGESLVDVSHPWNMIFLTLSRSSLCLFSQESAQSPSACYLREPGSVEMFPLCLEH